MNKLTKKDLVTLVELSPTLNGVLDGNPGYDIYTMFMLPPRALPTLSAIMKQDGWGNVEMLNPMFHGRGGRFTQENWNRIFTSRILGISSITRTAKQSITLADKYKQANPTGIVIAGGMDPSYRIADWLEHVDIIVMGEAERTLPELLTRLEKDESLEDLKGIAYKNKGEVVINPKRDLMSLEELGELPLPFYDKQTIEKSTIGVIEQERGCPHKCNFCLVTETYGSKIRYFPIENILMKIRQMQEYDLDPFFFSGDNLSGNPKHAIEMLEAIIEAGLSRYGRTAQVSVSAAKNHRLLRAMRDSGIKHLCVGFEAVTDSALRDLNKPFSAEQNTEAAKTFHELGFWINAMMMFGTDSDNKETARETIEWAKKYADSLQLSIPMPIPGTRFYKDMESQGRILTKDWSLYDFQHCLVRPTNFTPYGQQKIVFDMYREFYSASQSLRRFLHSPRRKISAAIGFYTLFGGLKRIISDPQSLQHLEFLKSIS